MKRQIFNKITMTAVGFLLAAGLMFTEACPAHADTNAASAPNAAIYKPLEHRETGIGALQRTDLDLAGTDALVQRFYEQLIAGENMDQEQLISDYHQIVSDFDLISDKMLALQAQYYMTPWDTSLGQQINTYRAFLLDQESYVRSLLNVTLQFDEYSFFTKELSEGERAYIRKTTRLPEMPGEETEGESENADGQNGSNASDSRPRLSEADSKKVMDLRESITDMIADYYILAGSDEKQPEQLTEVYLKLIAARNAMAKIYGFSDYTEYQAAFGSDVMPEETAEAVHTVIREKIAPVYSKVDQSIEGLQLSDLNGSAPTEMGQQWEALRPVIESIHPDLMEAFDDMTSNYLYLRSPAALSGYTAPLYTSNSAFIFTSPKEYLEEDYINMTHEFGHFNNDYHTADHHMYAETHLSVRELHSQGLELLSWHHSDKLFGPEENEAYRLFILGKKMVGILDGSVIDQLEREAYAHPVTTPEELKDRYMELYQQYYGKEPADPWFFTSISHIFDTPFYYMHYATSALNALSLWDEAFENEALAVERYMRASAADVWTSYKDMVSDCGLKNMQDPGEVRELADRIRDRVIWDEERRSAVLKPIYEERAQKAIAAEEARIAAEKKAEQDRRMRILLTAIGLFALAAIPALITRAVLAGRIRKLEERNCTLVAELEKEQAKAMLSETLTDERPAAGTGAQAAEEPAREASAASNMPAPAADRFSGDHEEKTDM